MDKYGFYTGQIFDAYEWLGAHKGIDGVTFRTFAPASRYGTEEDLKCMIDKFHQDKIGVILDFVPVHFALDDHGLANYDGTALYEYPHHDVVSANGEAAILCIPAV